MGIIGGSDTSSDFVERSAYYLEIEIPELPQTMNQLLARGHWNRKNHANKWHRLILEACQNQLPPAPIKKAKICCWRYSSRAADYDNIVSGFKHPIDGLVRAGVIEDDNLDVIGIPEFHWVKAPPKQGKIKLTVQSLTS